MPRLAMVGKFLKNAFFLTESPAYRMIGGRKNLHMYILSRPRHKMLNMAWLKGLIHSFYLCPGYAYQSTCCPAYACMHLSCPAARRETHARWDCSASPADAPCLQEGEKHGL
jgi:hypothetical protein